MKQLVGQSDYCHVESSYERKERKQEIGTFRGPSYPFILPRVCTTPTVGCRSPDAGVTWKGFGQVKEGWTTRLKTVPCTS
jgi:hypothetical protein